jgi:hypothetical protein
MKGKDFPETRLQVRLSTGGAPLVKSFKSDAREYGRGLWVGFSGAVSKKAGVKGMRRVNRSCGAGWTWRMDT